MKHRDTAEARVKELEDRLRCGEGSDRERQLLRETGEAGYPCAGARGGAVEGDLRPSCNAGRLA